MSRLAPPARAFGVLRVLLLAAGVLVAPAVRAQNYVGTSLPLPSNGINDAGQIVGFCREFACGSGSNMFGSFLYSGGEFTRLPVGGQTAGYATGINGAGQIVGTRRVGRPPPSAIAGGFLLTPTTVPEPGTLALLAVGVGVVGAGMRRRRAA